MSTIEGFDCIIIRCESKIWLFALHESSCYRSNKMVLLVVRSMGVFFLFREINHLLAFCPYRHVTTFFLKDVFKLVHTPLLFINEIEYNMAELRERTKKLKKTKQITCNH